jgi:hypothetical protein
MKFKEGSLAETLAKRGMSLTFYARCKGFTKKDIDLLGKYSNGTTSGTRKGRTKELINILREDGLVA